MAPLDRYQRQTSPQGSHTRLATNRGLVPPHTRITRQAFESQQLDRSAAASLYFVSQSGSACSTRHDTTFGWVARRTRARPNGCFRDRGRES